MHILKATYTLECTTEYSRLESTNIQLMLNFIKQLAPEQHQNWQMSINSQPQISIADFLTSTEVQKAADLQAETLIFLEKRKHERHDMRVQVTVMTGSRSFTTFSENISQGGLLLERSIPPTMRSDSARVFLVTPKKDKVIELKGKIAGEMQDQRHISFVDIAESAAKEISSWIEKYPGRVAKLKQAA